MRYFGMAGNAKLYSNRSAVYLAQKKYPQALYDAERAIQIEPEWAKPRARKVEYPTGELLLH